MRLVNELQALMPEADASDLDTASEFLEREDGYAEAEENLTEEGFYGDAEEVSEAGHELREGVAETVQQIYEDASQVFELSQKALEVNVLDEVDATEYREELLQLKDRSEDLKAAIEDQFDEATYEDGEVPAETYQIP